MLLHPFNILKTEFGLNDLHVTEGVDVALYVDDFGVVECTDHLKDAIDGAHMRQERVTETGTSGCTLSHPHQHNIYI